MKCNKCSKDSDDVKDIKVYFGETKHYVDFQKESWQFSNFRPVNIWLCKNCLLERIVVDFDQKKKKIVLSLIISIILFIAFISVSELLFKIIF